MSREDEIVEVQKESDYVTNRILELLLDTNTSDISKLNSCLCVYASLTVFILKEAGYHEDEAYGSYCATLNASKEEYREYFKNWPKEEL